MSRILYLALRFFAFIQRFSFRTFRFRRAYHPSVISGRTGRRSSSELRLEAVSRKIAGKGVSVLDVGCAEGLFALGLAQAGCTVLGIEGKLSRVVEAYADAAKARLKRVTFLNSNADSELIASLPIFDYVLLLAVWHHMVKRGCLEEATTNLKLLWSKCSAGLIFETGLTELSPDFGLVGWSEDDLVKYLDETLAPSEIIIIGRFESFDPAAFKSSSEKKDGSFERPIFFLKK